jgi:hypothetical protein
VQQGGHDVVRVDGVLNQPQVGAQFASKLVRVLSRSRGRLALRQADLQFKGKSLVLIRLQM